MPGLSPKLPVAKDPTDGFALTKTYNEMIKQNLMNLVLTSPGERMMDIKFGVGIRDFLFEQNTLETKFTIEQKINDQVSKYMPFIVVEGVEFPDVSAHQLNKLHIVIRYFIVPTGTLDALSFAVDLV
tara:strand:+ start:213 stop:593 length:381 start_codon:yes stop_codon:yes gene_type:complete